MRAGELILKRRRGKADISSCRESGRTYEQRLTEWGCSGCGFFEERSFKTRLSSVEQDAYAICRFAGEPVDLIWEATACLKSTQAEISKVCDQPGRARRPNCRHAA
jgi:hypothetical protein